MEKRIGNFIIDDDTVLVEGEKDFIDVATGRKQKESK